MLGDVGYAVIGDEKKNQLARRLTHSKDDLAVILENQKGEKKKDITRFLCVRI
jgi:hypothetical protein